MTFSQTLIALSLHICLIRTVIYFLEGQVSPGMSQNVVKVNGAGSIFNIYDSFLLFVLLGLLGDSKRHINQTK